MSFAEGFAVSELRDESVGGQRGVRFAASLLLAVNTNDKYTANDIADRLGEQPHRISFVFDKALDIQAIFRFAKEHKLGLEGLSNESLEITLDSLGDKQKYSEKDWRVLTTNRSGTGRLELFTAGSDYRGGPRPIRGSASKITPDRMVSVLQGSLPLAELVGAESD